LFENDDGREAERDHAFSSDRWLPCLLWFALALAIAGPMNGVIASFGSGLPAFLVVLLISVAITNVADAGAFPIDTEVTDLIGATTLPGLAALYAHCAAVVTHDSGPLHIARLVDAHVVALFGPTIPTTVMPVYLQSLLGFTAHQTGMVILRLKA